MAIYLQSHDMGGDRKDVVAAVVDLALEAVRAEAARWRAISTDRSLAQPQDNKDLRLVAEGRVVGVPRNDYQAAAREICRAWESAAAFLARLPDDEDD